MWLSKGDCGSCGLGELPAKPQPSPLPCAFGCRDWEPTASGWPWRALWQPGTVSGCRTLSCWKTSPAKLHSLKTWGNASRRTWSMWVAQGQWPRCPSVTCSVFAARDKPSFALQWGLEMVLAAHTGHGCFCQEQPGVLSYFGCTDSVQCPFWDLVALTALKTQTLTTFFHLLNSLTSTNPTVELDPKCISEITRYFGLLEALKPF